MNKKRFQRYILLQETGELSARKQARLKKAIERDPLLRTSWEEWAQIRDAWEKKNAEDRDPTFSVLQRIRNEAAAEVVRCQAAAIPVASVLRRPRLTFAYAGIATAILITGLYRVKQTHPEPAQPLPIENLDFRFTEALHQIDQTMLNLLDSLAESETAPSIEAEEDALALQLMILEDS